MNAPFLIILVIVVLYLISSIKILPEYERDVIFRLGRLLPESSISKPGSGDAWLTSM